MGLSRKPSRETLMTYAQAIMARQGYADVFSDNVRLIVINTGEETRGRDAVEQRIERDHDRVSGLHLRNGLVDAGTAAVKRTLSRSRARPSLQRHRSSC